MIKLHEVLSLLKRLQFRYAILKTKYKQWNIQENIKRSENFKLHTNLLNIESFRNAKNITPCGEKRQKNPYNLYVWNYLTNWHSFQNIQANLIEPKGHKE